MPAGKYMGIFLILAMIFSFSLNAKAADTDIVINENLSRWEYEDFYLRFTLLFSIIYFIIQPRNHEGVGLHFCVFVDCYV